MFLPKMPKISKAVEKEMIEAVRKLEFEKAALLIDQIASCGEKETKKTSK